MFYEVVMTRTFLANQCSQFSDSSELMEAWKNDNRDFFGSVGLIILLLDIITFDKVLNDVQ